MSIQSSFTPISFAQARLSFGNAANNQWSYPVIEKLVKAFEHGYRLVNPDNPNEYFTVTRNGSLFQTGRTLTHVIGSKRTEYPLNGNFTLKDPASEAARLPRKILDFELVYAR